jgi:hypothetical protein
MDDNNDNPFKAGKLLLKFNNIEQNFDFAVYFDSSQVGKYSSDDKKITSNILQRTSTFTHDKKADYVINFYKDIFEIFKIIQNNHEKIRKITNDRSLIVLDILTNTLPKILQPLVTEIQSSLPFFSQNIGLDEKEILVLNKLVENGQLTSPKDGKYKIKASGKKFIDYLHINGYTDEKNIDRYISLKTIQDNIVMNCSNDTIRKYYNAKPEE